MGGGACRFCLSLMSLSSIFVGIFPTPIKNLRCFLELPEDEERIKLLVASGGEDLEVSKFDETLLFSFNNPAELIEGGGGCSVLQIKILPQKMTLSGAKESVSNELGISENSKRKSS